MFTIFKTYFKLTYIQVITQFYFKNSCRFVSKDIHVKYRTCVI